MKTDARTLSRLTDISFDQFHQLRRARGFFMTQMLGRFYRPGTDAMSDQEHEKAAPVNLLALAVGTLVPNLAYQAPRARVDSRVAAFSDYSEAFGLALDYMSKKMRLHLTLRRCIVDAVFMAGFVKTGIADTNEVIEFDEEEVTYGAPFAERVSPDEMVFDPTARSWEEQRVIGNRYIADVDDLERTGQFTKAQIEDLRQFSSRFEQKNARGYGERIGQGRFATEYSELADYVDLVELYIPGENRVVTFPYTKGTEVTDFLLDQEYNGPETGPYHMLGLKDAPDNLLPGAPAHHWYDLHVLGNRVARKLARQAERVKRVLAYEADASEDAELIADADDGEAVQVQDVDKIREVEYGGASDQSYAWMSWVKQQFSEQTGNIDLLSGASADAPTLGQTELLAANASVWLSDMQSRVYSFTEEIFRDIGWFIHHDPLIEIPLAKREGNSIRSINYSADDRQGDWYDYTIQVRPYSLERLDPRTQSRRMIEFATTVIPAAAQAAQMLGPAFRVDAYLRDIADALNVEGAEHWIDNEEFQDYIRLQLELSMNAGEPGKAADFMKVPNASAINPGQPNPGQMGPTGGVSPAQEANAQRQELPAEAQAQRGASIQDMARARTT